MSQPNDQPETNAGSGIKEWTLMFFFATDNAIAPTTISQLKAIKQAGYHKEVNVVTRFDPRGEGVPTHVFDVNLINKLKDRNLSNIGFGGADPYVRNLIEDRLWSDEPSRDGVPIRKKIHERLKNPPAKDGRRAKEAIFYDPPDPHSKSRNGNGAAEQRSNKPKTGEPSPGPELSEFLSFCLGHYPARHYALFILGHGLPVGSDVFLFDEHADEHSLGLKDLGDRLRVFGDGVKDQKASFDLISFHSCSVSSLEVAYELYDTAHYMLAAQSPAFVGSWPYQQILTRIFQEVESASVAELVGHVFDCCYHNSTDYLLAGYSFAICLCDLRNVEKTVEGASIGLTEALREGLVEPILRDLILLAHWQSQSYWEETYTDLYDFCFCLKRYCEDLGDAAPARLSGQIEALIGACQLMMEKLNPGGGLVISSGFAGPAYQYSHGLSVFFPWSRPSTDNNLWFDKNETSHPVEGGDYSRYVFEATGWREFLSSYFEETRRRTRKTEAPRSDRPIAEHERADMELQEDMASFVYNSEGRLSADSALDDGRGRKTNPVDGVGEGCDCPSVKNFPRITRAEGNDTNGADPNRRFLPLSQGLIEDHD